MLRTSRGSVSLSNDTMTGAFMLRVSRTRAQLRVASRQLLISPLTMSLCLHTNTRVMALTG